ncbi:sensor histidine kinase [Chryseolinea lacunae]|uniref:Histidine kinase n=1 Tax=Chryseolinea lacunae TaxID=2801331 RepID=A0ABS1L1F7_9BACT|nr:histidine kinase [Chryseolinea lacunae]MBL0744366.1 histidine kinase [Chryseolinea lacunae]
MTDTRITLWQKLYRIKAHHLVLWVCYFLFWMTVYQEQYKSKVMLLFVISFYFVFNAATFYSVIYVLIPRYFNTRRYGLFCLLFVGMLLVASAGLAVCISMIFKANNSVFASHYSVIFFYALTSNGTVLGAFGAAKFLVDRVKNDRHSRIVEHQRLESELQYLKAQVNPHFLFNAINSVYFLIKKDPDMASETLIKLSDLLRFQLYDCSDDKIAIEKELEYLQNYIALEKLRKGSKVKVDYAPEGILSGFQIAPFLMIPFLENAFKFVSNDSDKPNEIRFGLTRNDNQLVATFFNTHDGLPKSTVGGIGLKNVKRRLELLYPDRHTLHIDSTARTYSVTLTLTL